MNKKRPPCTPYAVIEASAGYLLKETAERQEAMLSMLDPKVKRALRGEMVRQSLAQKETEAGGA